MTIFYVDDTASGANNGTSKTDAWTSFASATGIAAGDDLWVAHTHNESVSVDTTHDFSNATAANPIKILSRNFSGDALTKGATLTASNNNLNLFGSVYCNGMIIEGADDASFGGESNSAVFEDCTLKVKGNTGGGQLLSFGLGNGEQTEQSVTLIDTILDSDNVAVQVRANHCRLQITGGSLGSNVTAAFRSGEGSNIELLGFNMSVLTGVVLALNATDWIILKLAGCLIGTGASILSGTIDNQASYVKSHHVRIGTDADPTHEFEEFSFQGSVKSETGVYVTTDGATDEERSTPYSHAMVALANKTQEIISPLHGPWMEIFLDGDGSTAKTLTILAKRPTGEAAAYQNDELWLEGMFQNSVTTNALLERLTTRINLDDTPADVTNSGVSWTGSTGKGHSLALTSTPDKPGPALVRVCFAPGTGSDATLYYDPRIVVT